VAAGGKQRGTRDERERARVYQARRAYHEGQSRRRTRDNLIAGVAGGLLIVAVIAGQAAYFVVGPGVPAPSPTPSPSSTATPEPSASPTVPPTPAVTPEPTPAATR
jgi:hypothetical protein